MKPGIVIIIMILILIVLPAGGFFIYYIIKKPASANPLDLICSYKNEQKIVQNKQ